MTANDIPTDTTEAGVTTVGRFTTYTAAEAAVDRLSDVGFPVQGVRIVGHDVRTVEVVTGRLTRGRAAIGGMAGGAWTGLMLGLVLGLFVPGIAWLGVLLTSIGLGAAFGAALGFVGHLATQGRRDFSSVQSLRAATYDVVVPADLVADAVRVLAGPAQARPTSSPAPAGA